MRRLLVAFALCALLSAAPLASADHTGPVTRDFAASLALFPTHEELQALMREADAHPWATLHEISTSGKGLPVLLLEITDPDSVVPMEERIVTLILTQQHGNEPAGTGAAHQLLRDFLDGKALQDGVLANQVLLLMPMANPDGATANTRGNAAGVDINRDHVHLETSEARAIHDVLNRWDVHVAMDHHEYGGTGVGNPFPVRVYDYDLTTMIPNHGNVRTPTREASEELMYDVLWPAAEAQGYSANEYGEQTVAGVPVQQLAGGPDPGIMRNNFGLNNVAGVLIETRIDAHPNPFHDAQRRIDIQRLVMEAALAHASEHPEKLIAAKRESERLALEDPAREYVEGDVRAPMPAGFRARDATLAPLMMAHGLPTGIETPEGVVYATNVPRQGLLAAILHPSSSRAVTTAQPVDAVPLADDVVPAGMSEQASIPALPLAWALLIGGGVALVASRRTRNA